MPSRTADKFIADLNKRFGSGTAYYAKDMPPIEFRSTGSLTLDFALGTGGVPRNRVMEIFGPEGSGKTTLALLIASQFIDAEPDRSVLFLDMEHKLTPEWMALLVGEERMDSIIIAEPETIEEATEIYRRVLPSGDISVCILDSIGGAPTNMMFSDKRDVAKNADQQGGNAKGVTQFARFASNLSAKYSCLTIGINQVRDKMNSMYAGAIDTPGGRGWRHACVLRIKMKQGYESYTVKVNGEEVKVGYDVIAHVVKNHVASGEGRTATWHFFNQESEKYGQVGIDTLEETIRLSKLTGVVVRAGAYYRHAALPGGQVMGEEKLGEAIRADEKVRDAIVSDVMAVLSEPDADLSAVSPIVPVEEEDEDRPKGRMGMKAVPPVEEV